MKALVLTDINKLEYCDVPNPDIQDDEVLVEVKACGICGSDIHGMDGSSGRRIPPVIMGHEAAGVIVEKGKNVKNWQVADRVTFDSTVYPQNDWYTLKGMYNLSDNRMVLGVSCTDYNRNGAFAQYINIPQHILYKMPDNVSFEQAAMTEPLAVALHAVNLGDVATDDPVVVIGSGVIGLLLIQVLKARQVSQVIAVDQQTERLELARKLGADVTLDAMNDDIADEIRTLTDGRGAGYAFEAVGIEPTVALAISSVRKGGVVTLVGNITANIEFPLQKVVTRQIKIQGSCAINGEYQQALELIKNKDVDLQSMISATAKLSDGAEWFMKLYKKEKGLLKVILNP